MKSSFDIFMLEDLSNYLAQIEEEAEIENFSTETLHKISFLHNEITEVVKILKELC